jgi:hypothetical protein
MRALLFIFSFCLTTTCLAQDSLKTESRPRFYILLDYGKVLTLPVNYETKIEGALGLRVTRNFYLVGHLGHGSITPNNAIENGTYTSSGLYYRAGFDYYFSIDKINSISLGARYGSSSFEEDLSYNISSELFEDIQQQITRSDINAQWVELNVGSEAHLGNGPFYLGGYLNLRILVDRDEFDPTDTYTIPGYGRTFDKTIPALQLYLKVALF